MGDPQFAKYAAFCGRIAKWRLGSESKGARKLLSARH